jgi:hypothetical protein
MNVTEPTRAGNQAAMSDGTAGSRPDLSKCDVVYVVRPGDDNEELRYSLRSLANLPHRRVYIAGYAPQWCANVFPILTDQKNKPDQENSNANLKAALQDPELSDDFVFMNDDFYVMEPVEDIPALHQGLLDARITAYRAGGRMHQAYSLMVTRRALQQVPSAPDELLSYELHMPMLMNKRRALLMFKLWRANLQGLRPRTLYGNLYHISGKETQDAKGRTESQEHFISSVRNVRDDTIWQLLRERFPAPSDYESSTDGSRIGSDGVL